MSKILILKRDKLGDLLLCTPMIQVLRQAKPDAEIHLLASDYNAWVAKDLKAIDKLWVYPRTRMGKKRRYWAVIKQVLQMLTLRKEAFDAVIVAQGETSHRAIKRAAKIKAKRVISYCDDPKLLPMLTDPIDPKSVSDPHEAKRMIALLETLDIQTPEHIPFPVYQLTPQSKNFADRFIKENGIESGYAIIGLGARCPTKQPSAEQVLSIARWLHETYQLKTVFTWTPGKSDNALYPGDDETAEPILAAKKDYIVPFRGSISDALGLIWQARVSVFPDSGLMHFASASPGGVLGLFADRNRSPSPEQWAPFAKNSTILEAQKSVAELPVADFQKKIEKLLQGN